MLKPIKSAVAAICAAVTLFFLASNTWAAGAGAGIKADKSSLNWYMGMPVVAHVQIPQNLGGTGPSAPTDKAPIAVYMTAPMGDGVHATPDRLLPTPKGPRLFPAMQHTLGAVTTETQPRDGMGFFVIKGEKGDATNVKVNEFPKSLEQTAGGSMSGAPLAYEIKIGPAWVKLNSHVVIEYGARTGLLKLVPFMYSGRMWATATDGSPLEAPQCQLEAR